MRALQIMVQPIEFINILEVKGNFSLNEHGQIYVKGIIVTEKIIDYLTLGNKKSRVSIAIKDEEGREHSYFNGIIAEMDVAEEGQVTTLSFMAKTESCLLDVERHIRSFQKAEESYSAIMKKCLEDSGGKFIMRSTDAEIEEFLLQYEETDWEFAKRIAGRLETVLIPEFKTVGKKFYFGYNVGTKEKEIISDCYTVSNDFEQYWKKKENKQLNIFLDEIKTFRVPSREIYELGETVTFQGKKLVVGTVEAEWKGQELFHTYTLISMRNGVVEKYDNTAITGLSLEASVNEVKRDMVCVVIDKDENKGEAPSYWFHYATVYSTPDGTGWYCMPEPGDQVRIVFPSAKEREAYVASSVHLGMSGGRSKPEEKSWKNKQGKEILLAPDMIALKNNNGLLIELSDTKGILINSNKNVTIKADGDVNINSSGAGVSLGASDSLILQRGGSQIKIDDEVTIAGGKIYMN